MENDKRDYHKPCSCNKPAPAPCPKKECDTCHGSAGSCSCLPPKVVQVETDGCPILFRKVVIPAAIGDKDSKPPVAGLYRNVLLGYEANPDKVYLYSSDGIPTEIDVSVYDDTAIWEAIHDEEDARKDADDEIWTEIETIEASSDVVDVVGTYAELQQYDTSKLHDKDLIKVLQDETHDDAITYYRWSTSTSSFTYVGAEGPYYTASETDNLLADKQDKLVAGSNIQIAADGKTISATDTTYTHFTGATASADGVQGLVPGPLAGDEDKVLKGDGTWGTIQSAANTIFYMNASESGTTRHLYKASDMTGLVTMQDIIDANDDGQVIVRISTSVDPSMYSDMYLQNAYVASGDYQMIFLDNQYYYSFDTSLTSDSTFQFAKSEIQRKLTAGSNVQINGNTISATDTTYSDFTGATSSVAGAAGLVPAPATTDVDKYLKGDGTWGTITAPAASTTFYATDGWNLIYKDSGKTTLATGQDIIDAIGNGVVYVSRIDSGVEHIYIIEQSRVFVNGVEFYLSDDAALPTMIMLTFGNKASTSFNKNSIDLQRKLAAGTNISIVGNTISATDTTYSAFVGATSSVAGSAGLVPAPTTSDPDKFLKGDGTWGAPVTNNISSNDWSGLWQ